MSTVWSDEPTAVSEDIADTCKEVQDFCSLWEMTPGGNSGVYGDEDDDAGDQMRGMFGMMSSVPDLVGEDDKDNDEGYGGLTAEDDIDEAQWLRGTYEHLYKPEARPTSNLVDAVSRIGKRKEVEDDWEQFASFSVPAQPARKCTVVYDFV